MKSIAHARSWFSLRRLLAGVVLALLAALAMALVYQAKQQEWLAEYCGQRIATLSDDEVAVAVHDAAALGEPGLELLVEAIGSPRAAVAQPAQRILVDEVERLLELAPAEAARPLAIITSTLARESPQFGPAARQLAGELAERILSGLKPAEIDRGQLIADCAVVLKIAETAAVGPPASRRSASESLAATDRSVADFARAPRGAQPSSERFSGQPKPAEEPGPAPPRELPEASGETRTEPYEKPERFPRPLELKRIPSGEDPAAKKPVTTSAQANAPASIARASTGSDLANLHVPALMAELHGDHPPRVAAAAAELVRRGFPIAHLDLAKKLTDEDPAVRLALVDELPRRSGLDARPWLLQLAGDESAEVRLAALSVLITGADPKLLEQAAELCRADRDPRIVNLADRVDARRRKSSEPAKY